MESLVLNEDKLNLLKKIMEGRIISFSTKNTIRHYLVVSVEHLKGYPSRMEIKMFDLKSKETKRRTSDYGTNMFSFNFLAGKELYGWKLLK